MRIDACWYRVEYTAPVADNGKTIYIAPSSEASDAPGAPDADWTVPSVSELLSNSFV